MTQLPSSPRPRTLVLVAPVLALALAARAGADPARDPAALMSTGLAAYQAGSYDAAIAAFRAAYAVDERPAALFAIAQAERKRGDCAAAIADYDRFLATSPAERQADAARDQRRVCSDARAARAPAPEPVKVAPAPAPIALPPAPAAARDDDHASWLRDPVADGLLGGAAIGVALGAGFAAASSHAAHEADAADTYALHAARADAAARDRGVAIAGFAGAAALAGVAAWRVIHDRRGPHAPRALAIAPVGVPSGLGVALGGRF